MPRSHRAAWSFGFPSMVSSAQTSSLRFYRLLVAALVAALLAICVLFGGVLLQTWREHQAFMQQETQLRARLQQLQEHNAYQRQYLMRLLNDPEFFEKVVRSQLGYSRPGEIIFKFEP